MKKKYVHPVMLIVILDPWPLMIGGSRGGDTSGSAVSTPGVGSRRSDSFEDSDDGF